jgi:hypothetical protein
MTYKTKLTDDQLKIIDEVGARVERAFEEAREQLRTARIFDGDEGGSTRCLVCDCASYVFPGARRPPVCDRNGCRHAFTRHDVW